MAQDAITVTGIEQSIAALRSMQTENPAVMIDTELEAMLDKKSTA